MLFDDLFDGEGDTLIVNHTGKIITSGGNADIRELELELFSGDVEDIEAIGRDLAEKFSLRPGIVSKYARGIELYQKNS